METLSNSILTVQIAEHGAELQSIKKDGKEYLSVSYTHLRAHET